MRQIPHDVLGVVLQFLSDDVATIHRGAAKVSSRWHTAFLEAEQLWTLLTKKRWPTTKIRSMKASAFRGRVLAERSLYPLKPEQLTEIENCNFECHADCPTYAELLRETEEKSELCHPVLFCDVCKRKLNMFVVDEDGVQTGREDLCANFAWKIAEPSEDAVAVAVIAPKISELIALNALLADVTDWGGQWYAMAEIGPTLRPLRILYSSDQNEWTSDDVALEFHPFERAITSSTTTTFKGYLLSIAYKDEFEKDSDALCTSLNIARAPADVFRFFDMTNIDSVQDMYCEVSYELSRMS